MKPRSWLMGPVAAFALAQAPAVHEVQVAPAGTSVVIGATSHLRAAAYDAAGNVIATGVRYTWSSSNVNVVRVDTLGVVTGVAKGTAVVRAEAKGSGTPPKAGASAVTVR